MKKASFAIKYLILLLTCFLMLTNVSAESQGLTFNSDKLYRTSKTLSRGVNTFEITLMFPNDTEGEGGVLLSSFSPDSESYLNIEVTSNGNPLILWRGKYGVDSYTFGNVRLYNGQWTHLAITRDIENKTLKCYINGDLIQTISLFGPVFCENYYTEPFAVGGDHKIDNPDYFRGRMKNVKAYYDVRSEEEIRSDYLGNNDVHEIAFFYNMTDLIAVGSEFIVPDKSGNDYDLITDNHIPPVDSSEISLPVPETSTEILTTSEAQSTEAQTSSDVTTEAASTSKNEEQTTPEQTTTALTESIESSSQSMPNESTSPDESALINVQGGDKNKEKLEGYFLVIAAVCGITVCASLVLVILATKKKK